MIAMVGSVWLLKMFRMISGLHNFTRFLAQQLRFELYHVLSCLFITFLHFAAQRVPSDGKMSSQRLMPVAELQAANFSRLTPARCCFRRRIDSQSLAAACARLMY